MDRFEKYLLLSFLFRYPDDHLPWYLEQTEKLVREYYPVLMSPLLSFREETANLQQKELEEYFVRTFEVEAICNMDIGYVLFGEDYKRGVFLASMQKEQQKAENSLDSELADHLPNVLSLLPKMKDKELAMELAWCVLTPAVGEMVKKTVAAGNLYRFPLGILFSMLNSDFTNPAMEQALIGRATPQFDGAEEYTCGNDFLFETGKPKF